MLVIPILLEFFEEMVTGRSLALLLFRRLIVQPVHEGFSICACGGLRRSEIFQDSRGDAHSIARYCARCSFEDTRKRRTLLRPLAPPLGHIGKISRLGSLAAGFQLCTGFGTFHGFSFCTSMETPLPRVHLGDITHLLFQLLTDAIPSRAVSHFVVKKSHGVNAAVSIGCCRSQPPPRGGRGHTCAS